MTSPNYTQDGPKHFIIKRSDIEGRIDPQPYHPERLDVIKKLEGSVELLKLKNIVINKKKITNQVAQDDIYVGLENIKSDTGEYIETKDKTSISSAGIFEKGQILFPKLRPYLNKVYLAEFDGICSTEFHIFDSKGEFTNEFLTIYLRSDLIVKQTKHLMTGNTLPRLQTSDIDNLPVPVIDKQTQQKIVNLYQSAYTQKQQKEKQAQELLNSINTYLLNELGITMPFKDNSLKSRMFTTKFSEISGYRFDPSYQFHSDFKIEGGKYENIKLRVLANISKGQSITSDKIEEGDYPVIAGGQSSPYNHSIYNYKGNVITVSASGAYSGYVWYHNYPIFASDCSVIWSKDEEKVSTYYLAEILKLKQDEVYKLQQGAGQPHVYASDLIKLNIPVPKVARQSEIIKNITKIREQAKQLQQEAQQVLNQAKIQVENIILNNE